MTVALVTRGLIAPLTVSGGGGGDTTPPAVTIVSAPTSSGDPFVVDITDVTPGVGYLGLFVDMPDTDGERVVYRRGEFKAPFIIDSRVEVIADGLRITVYHEGMSGGWPVGTTLFYTDAIDSDGNDEGP